MSCFRASGLQDPNLETQPCAKPAWISAQAYRQTAWYESVITVAIAINSMREAEMCFQGLPSGSPSCWL